MKQRIKQAIERWTGRVMLLLTGYAVGYWVQPTHHRLLPLLPPQPNLHPVMEAAERSLQEAICPKPRNATLPPYTRACRSLKALSPDEAAQVYRECRPRIPIATLSEPTFDDAAAVERGEM